MVSAIRQARRDRQKAHIPSKKAWDPTSNQWIHNPEIKKKVKHGSDRAAARLKAKGQNPITSTRH